MSAFHPGMGLLLASGYTECSVPFENDIAKNLSSVQWGFWRSADIPSYKPSYINVECKVAVPVARESNSEHMQYRRFRTHTVRKIQDAYNMEDSERNSTHTVRKISERIQYGRFGTHTVRLPRCFSQLTDGMNRFLHAKTVNEGQLELEKISMSITG
jgi:hypothetical protein